MVSLCGGDTVSSVCVTEDLKEVVLFSDRAASVQAYSRAAVTCSIGVPERWEPFADVLVLLLRLFKSHSAGCGSLKMPLQFSSVFTFEGFICRTATYYMISDYLHYIKHPLSYS